MTFGSEYIVVPFSHRNVKLVKEAEREARHCIDAAVRLGRVASSSPPVVDERARDVWFEAVFGATERETADQADAAARCFSAALEAREAAGSVRAIRADPRPAGGRHRTDGGLGMTSRPDLPVNGEPMGLATERNMTPTTMNRHGEWVPAIPLPFFLALRKQCQCGRKFWTREGYRAHYALAHVLVLSEGPTEDR